jgi:curved DNA-binding protein CbpA
MDCNKEEALRAKAIAEKKMESRDFVAARKFALKAQKLYPVLENIAQMLVVCDVHCSAEQKVVDDEVDWYGILQLEHTVGDTMIKKQYRKFALQLHPDKNKFAGAEAAFKLIGEAQRVLLDREKRTRYDMKVKAKKTAMPHHNPQKVPANFNSAMKNNAGPNFTNSKTQQQPQQQQNKQPAQQQNGERRTFWTACPFCSVKYQYYREVVNKPLRCQHCHKPFIAYIVEIQGTSQTTNSSQQASKENVGSQGNSHAEKSNTNPFKNKVPVGVSRKSNVKRNWNQVEECSQSSDSTSVSDFSDSEIERVGAKYGFPGVRNHSTEQQRRSVRQKQKVSYSDNMSNNDNDLLRPSKKGHENRSTCGDGQSHGGKTKTNDQNGVTADPKDEHEKVKQKQDFHSKESSLDRNEEKKRASGKEAVGGSKHMDETLENSSPNSMCKTTTLPNAYPYFNAEFSDFDKDKKQECFAPGQIWAIYDATDGMPRLYALIRKVFSPGFKLQATWLEPHPDDKDEIKWVDEELPVACGKFKLGATDIFEDHQLFSHLVQCERIGRNTFHVYPRKGETWALLKNWDIKWYMDAESHKQYEYEFVEILSDYANGEGVYVGYLGKLKGFVSLFFRILREDNKPFQIPSLELFRFSHMVPSFKMTGQEGVGVHLGYLELDPASLPMNLEEIAVPQNLDAKIGPSSCGSENARSSKISKPLMTPDKVISAPKFNVETSNMTEVKDSFDDIDDCHACPDSTPEAFEIPDAQFFNFETGRSLDKFQIGQIWAFYSDEDEMPKYYGQIKEIETSPDLKLHVYWLACCWLPQNTIKWEDEHMLTSCGRFKVIKTNDFLSTYSNLSCISHQVQADAIGKNYAIYPKKGEVWALYRNWSNKIKCSDLKKWEYDIVEVLEEADLFIETLVLEQVSGFSSVFRGKSNEGSSVSLRISRKELLRFSHQIPAFKLTEQHGGNLRGFWELDPGAVPPSFLWP